MAVLMKRLVKVGASALAVVVAVLGLSSCSSRTPVLAEGERQASPSGAFTAELRAEGSGVDRRVHPVILDAAGSVVWADEQRYEMRAHPVGVLWQAGDDVLWLLSADLGNSRVLQVAGAWTQEWNVDPLPPDIEKLVRR